jgi:hypothetical protein
MLLMCFLRTQRTRFQASLNGKELDKTTIKSKNKLIAEPLAVVRVALGCTLVLVWQSKELRLLLVEMANSFHPLSFNLRKLLSCLAQVVELNIFGFFNSHAFAWPVW